MTHKREDDQLNELMDSDITDEIFNKIVKEFNGHFRNYGVEVLSFSITNVHLPPVKLEDKISNEKQSQIHQAKNKQYLENLDKYVQAK